MQQITRSLSLHLINHSQLIPKRSARHFSAILLQYVEEVVDFVLLPSKLQSEVSKLQTDSVPPVFFNIYIYIFNLFIFYFIYLFILAALGLRCCAWAFSSCCERGLLFVAMHRLLTAVVSLVVEHGL